MKTYEDIAQMAAQDYSIGLTAHYKPLAQLINERNYKTVIEVGTAYGGNAYHMLTNTKIEALLCVDPYLYYTAMPGLTCQEDYDTLYKYAFNRMQEFYERVTFIRRDSRDAYVLAPAVDLIFLDGSHNYEDVKLECENYSKLVNDGGILCGHDWDIFEGVNKAVNEFSAFTHRQIHTLPGNIWYINY